MILAASLGLIAVATLMLLGWGWVFRRLLGLEDGTWPVTVALGLAGLVFIGGILNLARLARPPALIAVAALGVLLAVAALRKISFERPHWAVLLLIAGILIFTIATQLPPSIYNFHDDFQKYFAYPMRMVETGTVAGSRLSAIGLQTLGGQAFLDAFVIAFFPISYINGVDAVFGLFLCLILAGSGKELLATAIVCVLSVVSIDPLYVNISTLYLGSALIMAIVAFSVESATPSAAALGLAYAALIAMKPTFALFAAIHLAALATIAIRDWRWALRTGAAAAGFLSPWILVHVPNYLAAMHAHLPAPAAIAGAVEPDSINLLSFEGLEYGAPPASFTVLTLAIGICAWICYRSAAPAVAACCVSGVVSFFAFVYIFGPFFYGYDHAMRYFTPVAIGIAPTVFGLTGYYARRDRFWIPFLVATISVAAFAPFLATRVRTELRTHSGSSIAWLALDREYSDYNRRVLTGTTEWQTVLALQQKVPAGAPILAWINTPFYLDFARNPIADIDTAGIGTPWADVEPVLSGTPYLIWDYAGFATLARRDYEERALEVGPGERKNAAMTLAFLRILESRAEQGESIADTGEIKVVRLKTGARTTSDR